MSVLSLQLEPTANVSIISAQRYEARTDTRSALFDISDAIASKIVGCCNNNCSEMDSMPAGPAYLETLLFRVAYVVPARPA